MKPTSLILCLFLILIVSGCPTSHTPYTYKMYNNAGYDIFAGYGLKSSAPHFYPDTSFEKLVNYRLIKSHSFNAHDEKHPLEETIQRETPRDTVSIFYFHADTVSKYPWDIIQRDYKILRRYDLSPQDIITLKNKYDIPEIPYPPDARMKNMKMYPPYGK